MGGDPGNCEVRVAELRVGGLERGQGREERRGGRRGKGDWQIVPGGAPGAC